MSTCAPWTGAQSASALKTYIVSVSAVPVWPPRTSERLSFSSTKYGPSVFSGVMTHVAEAASAGSIAGSCRDGRR